MLDPKRFFCIHSGVVFRRSEKMRFMYYEFRISVAEESRDAIINRLSEMGSTGFHEKDEMLLAYFEDQADIASICDSLERFSDVLRSSRLDPAFTFEYSILPETDWNENWKKSFEPIDIGENLTIIPSWLTKTTNRLSVIIDPGMVFGTGYHETSRACLVLMEKISKDSNRERCLDIGTGSGILAISAARLGYGHVTAIDIDPMAIDAAQRNVQENGLESVTVREGDIFSVDGQYDLIVANLLSGILIDIAPDIFSRLNPDGMAILSGMLSGQESNVIAAYEAHGLVLRETVTSGTWVTLVFSR